MFVLHSIRKNFFFRNDPYFHPLMFFLLSNNKNKSIIEKIQSYLCLLTFNLFPNEKKYHIKMIIIDITLKLF